MPQFLTTSGTSYHIERIIIEAKQNIVLLSPYLYLSRTLLERLQDADKRGTKILIVFSQNKLRKAEIEVLKTLENIHIKYSENLHAKCYFNRNDMIITSMNMYEFSEKNNREMGILLNRSEDKDLYADAYKESVSIFDAALPCDVSGNVIGANSSTAQKVVQTTTTKKVSHKGKTEVSPVVKKGFCISCHADIDFNPYRPLCAKCYVPWVKTKKRKEPQKYCHECGLEKTSSVAIPRCKDCFAKK